VSSLGELEYGEDGAPLRMIGTIQDITERKEAEEALRESRERLAFALEGTNDGIWDVQMDTGAVYLSPRDCELLGYEPGEMAQVATVWNQLVHPEDHPRTQAAMADHLEGRAPILKVEHRLRTKSGDWKWFLARGKVVAWDEQGNPQRMVGTHTDISERKAAEMRIQLMNEELEQRVKDRTAQLEVTNRELEAFSYSVSHDLRGPLRGIDGFSLALVEDYGENLDETAKHYLARIRSGTQRMGMLIDDLLKLSRINHGELDRSRVDLSVLAQKILDELARQNPDRRVEVTVQPGMTPIVDKRLVQIVLDNLLGNAWKFTSKKEIGRIEFGAGAGPEGETVFHIRDNGAGFDMSYADKLFNAFQRLHGVSEFEGTGIGLAIVQRIIHRHGGRIWAEAEPGMGATFFFTLPDRGTS
jgi:PAS domain S-box-containing protein